MTYEQKLAWLILDGWVYNAYRIMREGNDYATKPGVYYVEWSHIHGFPAEGFEWHRFAEQQGDQWVKPWTDAPKKFVNAVYDVAKDLS